MYSKKENPSKQIYTYEYNSNFIYYMKDLEYYRIYVMLHEILLYIQKYKNTKKKKR